MLVSLHHRGPDQAKARSWPDCTFLHTRLRIIDLTESGDQPLGNEDGSIFTVFNGEIYNHAPLRSALERRRHSFRGHSDTEVIPHLYEEHDVGLFERLRGMFSIAIFDQRRRRLVLGRDRFGIKPLFYAQTPDFVAFSSEIGALRLLPGIDLGADRQAVSDFTALLFVPAPLTIHRGIRAVRPGEVLDFSIDRQERIESRSLRFHTFSVAPNADLTLEGAIGQAESLVDAAVASQLESDVPLGAMLSGGIDSSLVCAVAQGHLPGDLLTFGVRQAEAEYDETWAAQAVAQEIGSRHTTLEMGTRRGSWEDITSVLGQVGQPFGDSSIFAVDQISAAMRSHVTVALSGDGGDEGFGGYPAYWRVATIDRLQRIPRPLRQLLAPLAGPASRLGLIPATLASRVADLAVADDVGVIQTLFSWIRDGEHRRLVHAHDEVEPARRLFEPEWPLELPAGASRLERLTAMAVEANLRLVLASGFLTKVDAASMRHSLEVRVPLLDEDLIAFGLTLPHRLRVDGQTGKRVLRGVAARHLPESIVTRPKHGFDVPVDSFIDDSFRARLRETLLADGSPVGGYLDRKVYGPWITAFCDRQELRGISRESLYERTIMLLSLDLSLRAAPAPRI